MRCSSHPFAGGCRPSRRRGIARLAAALAPMLVAAAPALAQPINDDCSSPTPISGNGTFFFDTTTATTGSEGQGNIACSLAGTTGIENDIWFCWTANCDGLVRIETCGQTQVDTKMAFYIGCACPVVPQEAFCCNDDACGVQSIITCEVVCGEQYLIQIGDAPGTAPGSGTFTVFCEGTPCAPPPPPACGDCCGTRPDFNAPDYAIFGGEVVAMATSDAPLLSDFVLHAIDLSNQASAPIGAPPTGQNWNTPFYHHPTWVKGELGTVFGVAIDDVGNVYVAHSSVYGLFGFPADAIGGLGAAGSIYKIDAVTGAASPFVTLPNSMDPSIQPPSESWPGIGNICFDCDRHMLYATNHEDGKIYRIDASGAILSTFDHGGPDDGAAGFAPLRERLWAVQTEKGRLYYSVWVEDTARQSFGQANEIWSVACDASGDFVPGTDQLEISMPAYAPNYPNTSSPVSDIAFNEGGCMLVAERSMSNDTTSNAHQSRVLEFCFNGVNWVPSTNTFGVGAIFDMANSAGGIDADFAPNSRVWASADAVQFGPQIIYGLQGLPATGGTVDQSILIDIDQEFTQVDKYQIGSVEVTCQTNCCMTITNETLECATDGSGTYTWTFDVTNQSGVDAYHMLITPPPGVTVMPNMFNTFIPDGGTGTFTVTIGGVTPGTIECLFITLLDASIQQCCSIEHCLDFPECDCMVVTVENIECNAADGSVSFSFFITNLTGDVLEHMYLFPPAGVTIVPNYFDLLSVPPLGTAGPFTVSITGAAPNSQLCFPISIHDQFLQECCSIITCIDIPDCSTPPNPCDLNQSGSVDIVDLLILLGNWGACQPGPCLGDLNNDGVVNISDLLSLLSNWG